MALIRKTAPPPALNPAIDLPKEFPSISPEFLRRFPDLAQLKAQQEQWWYDVRSVLSGIVVKTGTNPAAKGEKGDKGERGEKGQQGPAGPGAAPSSGSSDETLTYLGL